MGTVLQLGNYEANVLTTTELSLEETVAGIKEGLEIKDIHIDYKVYIGSELIQ